MPARRDYRWTLHRDAMATETLFDLLLEFPDAHRSREMVRLAWLGLRAHRHYGLQGSFINDAPCGESMKLRFSLDHSNTAELELLDEMAPFNRPQAQARILSLAWLGASVLSGTARFDSSRPQSSPYVPPPAIQPATATPMPLRPRRALAPVQEPEAPQSFGVLEQFDVDEVLVSF